MADRRLVMIRNMNTTTIENAKIVRNMEGSLRSDSQFLDLDLFQGIPVQLHAKPGSVRW